VERLNLTLERKWAYARPYCSNQQRLDALPAWVHDYNHHRPHRALNRSSPMLLLNNLPTRTSPAVYLPLVHHDCCGAIMKMRLYRTARLPDATTWPGAGVRTANCLTAS
jgi:transposase InsO family protein